MAQKKSVSCRFSEMDSITKEMASFGWDQVGVDFNKNRTKAKIKFERREMKTIATVRYLERQYLLVSKGFHISTLIWIALSGFLFMLYYLLTDFQFRVIFLFIAIPVTGITAFIFFVRLILWLNRRKYRKMIIKKANVLSGNIREIPFSQNIAPNEENSNLLRKNLKKISKKK